MEKLIKPAQISIQVRLKTTKRRNLTKNSLSKAFDLSRPSRAQVCDHLVAYGRVEYGDKNAKYLVLRQARFCRRDESEVFAAKISQAHF